MADANLKWKDISSYSKSDTDRAPRTWSLPAAGLTIIVTRHLDFPADAWVMRCAPFCDNLQISTGTVEEAKAAAVAYVRANLYRCLTLLGPAGSCHHD